MLRDLLGCFSSPAHGRAAHDMVRICVFVTPQDAFVVDIHCVCAPLLQAIVIALAIQAIVLTSFALPMPMWLGTFAYTNQRW